MTEVLLLDFGGVLHDPGETTRLDALAGRLGVPPFVAAYLASREEFDRGQSPEDYWAALLGRPLSEAELADATEVDIAQWDLVPPAIEVATRRAREAGFRLALLSNMPHPEADAYESRSWTAPFEQLFFSCRLGLVKPDPAIYAHVIDALGVAPAAVTFLEDRPDNVAAAAALGIDARLTVGTAATVATLDALVAAR